MTEKVYVGVNLVTERVTVLAQSPDDVRDAYVLAGSQVGPIVYLEKDDSRLGREAAGIAVASNAFGITFAAAVEPLALDVFQVESLLTLVELEIEGVRHEGESPEADERLSYLSDLARTLSRALGRERADVR